MAEKLYRKPIVFAGYVFPSRRDLARYLGLPENSIYHWIKITRALKEVLAGERPPPDFPKE